MEPHLTIDMIDTVTARLVVGVAHGDWYSVEFDFRCPVEFAPDDVFAAANRVLDVDDDCAERLTTDWQKDLRRALDRYAAPSMSVGDHFTIVTPRGDVTRYRCDRVGWTITTEVAR